MKFIYLFILMSLISCTSTKDKGLNKTTKTMAIPCEQEDSKIMFLNFNIIRDSDNKITASLINKIITDGKLKSRNPKSAIKKEGDFECILLDKKSIPIDSYYIPNPLIKNIEYIDSSGALSRKIIELDNAELSLRMELVPCTNHLSFEVINKTNLKLLKIEL